MESDSRINHPAGSRERLSPLRPVLAQAKSLGLVGPGPVEAHIEHAIAYCGAYADVVGRRSPTGPALDLGSGAGIPGLALALWWDASRWVLLDAGARRSAFLRQAIEALGISQRVSVVEARAENAGRDPQHRGGYDLVVARGFASPAVTAECASPLLSLGGWVVVSDPPEPDPERWPASGLAELGLVSGGRVRHGAANFHFARQAVLCSDRYPRRVGIPAKRPLF